MERKQLLKSLLHTSERIRYSDHQVEKGRDLFELAKQNGLEGIVAKRLDSRYLSGRSTNWLKLKTSKTLDVVVGGWDGPSRRGCVVWFAVGGSVRWEEGRDRD